MTELPAPAPDWALFLDFDGTLVDLQARPDAVTPSGRLHNLLHDLAVVFDGAVAIVSGRTVTDLGRLLQPLELPLAGLHGLERRTADGTWHADQRATRDLDAVRDAVAGFTEARPGLLLEDKGGALAVHYRKAPQRCDEVAAFLARQCDVLGEGFHVQPGKSVFEVKPSSCDKAGAVCAFMDEPPFAGRVPVFIGDDRNDEDAFAWVNAHDGWSIRVANADTETCARARIESVAALGAWLEHLADTLRRRR